MSRFEANQRNQSWTTIISELFTHGKTIPRTTSVWEVIIIATVSGGTAPVLAFFSVL